jgi:hypothetical protein
MMVYDTQQYWISGLCALSGILNTRKHNVWETDHITDWAGVHLTWARRGLEVRKSVVSIFPAFLKMQILLVDSAGNRSRAGNTVVCINHQQWIYTDTITLSQSNIPYTTKTHSLLHWYDSESFGLCCGKSRMLSYWCDMSAGWRILFISQVGLAVRT